MKACGLRLQPVIPKLGTRCVSGQLHALATQLSTGEPPVPTEEGGWLRASLDVVEDTKSLASIKNGHNSLDIQVS